MIKAAGYDKLSSLQGGIPQIISHAGQYNSEALGILQKVSKPKEFVSPKYPSM